MDDKGRCLEQLSLEVQRLTLVEIQKSLLAGEVERGADLLSTWEQYLKLSKNETNSNFGHETLSTTVGLFLKRLGALQNVLNSLPKKQCVNTLQEKLNTLEERISLSKTDANEGGTFEWVDSILVKCLQEGSWLIIDNVNLCSPAVLDRLNGLLEPGGELVLGERGVGKDGQLVTVKPHPDFRLFLVMDPRFGEISRAMRNRGVELFLLDIRENPTHILDLQAILSHIGLKQYNQQTTLLNIYQEMRNLAIGFDPITTSDMFHAAALTVEQTLRGQPLSKSMRSACYDVYVQSRQLSPDQRDRCGQLLGELFKRFDKLLTTPATELRDGLAEVTLNTLALQENSAIAQLNHKCALLSNILRLVGKNICCNVKDILKEDLIEHVPLLYNKTVNDIAPYILLTLISSVTENDLLLRKNMILSVINSSTSNELKMKLFKLVLCLISAVHQATTSENACLKELCRTDLCWDLRRVSPWILNSKTYDYENKIIVLLHYYKQCLELSVSIGRGVKTTIVKNMSALDFSTAYNQGKVTLGSVTCDTVLHLSLFLKTLKDQVDLLLESKSSMDEEQCCRLLCALHWNYRLIQLGQQPLFLSQYRHPEPNEELISLLRLHIGWVRKWLFPELTRLLTHHPTSQESSKLPPQLLNMCADIYFTHPLRSVSKKIRILRGQPLPWSSKLQIELIHKLSRFEINMSLWYADLSRYSLQRKVEYLLSAEGKRLRKILVQAFQLINSIEDLERATELLLSAESCLSIANPRDYDQDREVAKRRHASSWSWEVPLWPLRGVIYLRLMASVRLSTNQELADYARDWAKELPIVLPETVALVFQDSSRLRAESALLMELSGSITEYSPRAWLQWASLYEQDDQPNFAEQDDYYLVNCRSDGEYPLHTPLLALFSTSLLYPQCDIADMSPVTASLRSLPSQSKLLAALKQTLWTFGPAFAAESLNYRITEEQFVKQSYFSYLKSLETVVKSKLLEKELNPNERKIYVMLDKLLETKKFERSSNNEGLPSEVKSFFTDLARHIDTIETAFKELLEEQTESVRLMLAGSALAHLGLAQMRLFSYQDPADPVQKKSFKVQYCQKEREELECALGVEQVQELLLGSLHFPLTDAFSKRISFLTAKEDCLKKFVAVRPQSNKYSDLYNEIQQFLTVIVNPGQRVETVVTSLSACMVRSNGVKSAVTNHKIQEALDRAKSLRSSFRSYIKSVSDKYKTWYPDVVFPVLSAITQIIHGFTLMIGAIKKNVVCQNIAAESLLRTIVRFPLPDCSAAQELVNFCTSSQTLDILKSVVSSKVKAGETSSCEIFRLGKCCLEELRNVASIRGEVGEGKDWSVVCGILDHLVRAWQQQERERAQKEQEEGSYFINKAKKVENLTEEEEDEFERKKLFPSYREKDFADLEPPSLEQKKFPLTSESVDQNFKLTLENIVEIHKIHSVIVTKCTKAHWIYPMEPDTPDFITPFANRLAVFSVLLNSLSEGCDSRMDAEFIPALCLGVHLNETHGTIESHIQRKKYYDFYHDSNVGEVKLCVPLLESLAKRVLELLEEWPDHPTLKQIMLVIERVLDFPSHSPVSRFLVGLELLLTKLKEWEENAHAGVTLGPHSAAVTRQILDWRRLELSQWKGCLESARIRLSESAVSKWWFHLYSLVREETDFDAGQLASALNQFMEESNLAEYQTRLGLLYTFHCHTVNSRQKLQSQVLWNVHQYYSQFSRLVIQRIKELSVPVEKKLRDFVKIARWNDINYWAVKETVDRTHRTLFKYIREYESILKQPARLAMVKLESANKETSPSQLVNAALYTLPAALAESLPEDVEGESLLCRERSLFRRARKLCRDTITKCPLPQNITALLQVVEEFHEVAEVLSIEDIDRSLSKDKQKSAARSILHRKRKTVTDLFHTLADLGLSYRAGLVALRDQEEHFTSQKPLNIEAGLAQIDSKNADKELIAAWVGCDLHWLHCVARQAQLKTFLTKPHKDLGPPVVDRCKGFTNHLMSLCYQQKKSMTESVTSLYVLRCLIQLLTSLQPSHIELLHLQNDLSSIVEDIIYCLAQFEILIDSCPAAPCFVDSEVFYVPPIPDTVETVVYNGDNNWTVIKSKLTSMVKCCKKIKNLLDGKAKYKQFLNNFQKSNDFNVLEATLTHEDFTVIEVGFSMLSTVNNDIGDIQNVFRMKVVRDKHPVVYSLNYLQQKIEKLLSSFSSYQRTAEELGSVNEESQTSEIFPEKSTEVLLNKVLFAIQELYKSNIQQENQPKPSDIENTDCGSENVLFDLHLKEKIILALQSEMKTLMLPEVTIELKNLLLNCRVHENSNIRVAHRCLPLLQQYSLLAQFLVTQQVSAFRTSAHLCSNLLSVFIDLANKGFRVPEELLDEEAGEGSENMAGGLGLGEGEGEKDVSDQIESQDQLEDAKKPGEHDQEEDKDCKEEEKGIEMTDDFGGKLQDIEKKKDEEGSGQESGEEEEPDKEMGDTEKGADTLDQQIWGGDSDEEEEDEGDKEEEQGERGEQMGEKEMGARDENKTPQGEEDDKQGNEEKTDKKKEINEMEEPEVDDDQIDPYHGKNPPQPEPEPLDLPDDLQLDDGEGHDKDEDGEEDNPFEIDNMKEPKLPEEEEVGPENDVEQKDEKEDKENDPEVDSSDEDDEGNIDSQVPEEMEVDQPDEKQDQAGDDGGAKDENKTGEEAKMEEDKNKEEEEEAKPSEDLPASEAVPSSQQDSGSKDQVRQPESSQQSKELNPEDSEVAEGPDQQGVGAASSDQQDAQQGNSGENSQAVHAHSRELREEKRQRPGDSEEQRALGDVQEPMKKKLKTINMEKEEQTSQDIREEEGIQEDQTSDMYQHIKEAKHSRFDAQTLDAATEDQVAEQKLPNKDDEQCEDLKDDQDMAMDQEESKLETEKITSIYPDTMKEVSEDKKQEGMKQADAEGNRVDMDPTMQVEGELIETSTVKRGEESTFHTKVEDEAELGTRQVDFEHERMKLEQQLSTWSQPPANEEAARAWERLSNVTADLSRELSEQLRLVLEPTHASRLKGDFRTGRRINMRKVIPYIASQFRKDKIWLRRTKPAKREYQIVLAVDDSSSMADNHSKELAFESLAVVSKALSLLEAGQLAVLSFGDEPKILHQLGDTFTEHCGARLLQQFSFEQQKTHVGSLVNFACSLFTRHPPRRGVTDVAQLLVIVSDGRGVLSDGEGVVTQAVRRAKHMGIFMVFVIVDNPQNKDSILDIRLPKFSGGKLLGIVPYMDSFPFPFYLILRDINSLPSVLSDALRQWFELVTSTS